MSCDIRRVFVKAIWGLLFFRPFFCSIHTHNSFLQSITFVNFTAMKKWTFWVFKFSKTFPPKSLGNAYPCCNLILLPLFPRQKMKKIPSNSHMPMAWEWRWEKEENWWQQVLKRLVHVRELLALPPSLACTYTGGTPTSKKRHSSPVRKNVPSS